MTVSALFRLFEGFLLAKEAADVADTTLETYRVMFRSLNLPPEKYKDPQSITPQDLQTWVVSLSHYAAATHDQRIAKAFFGSCSW